MRTTTRSDGRGRALSELIADWAAAHPAIKRVWLFSRRGEDDADPHAAIDVALELEPVGDSEETLAAWLGKGEAWRGELQSKTGRGVELEWLDPDESMRATESGEARMLVFERAG